MNLTVILLVVHVFLAIGIITLILLQKGAGASAGAAFGGGGGAGSVFGASGSSNFMSKTTAILATLFFINSLTLAFFAANREKPQNFMDMIENSAPAADVQPLQAPAMDQIGDDSIPMPAEADMVDDVPPPAE